MVVVRARVSVVCVVLLQEFIQTKGLKYIPFVEGPVVCPFFNYGNSRADYFNVFKLLAHEEGFNLFVKHDVLLIICRIILSVSKIQTSFVKTSGGTNETTVVAAPGG